MDWQHHLFWLPGLINFIALIRWIKYGRAHFFFYFPCSLLFEGIFTRSWIGHFRVPKTRTFKMRPSAQPFLWKWGLFAREWKVISISKTEHLTSFWYRGSAGIRKWPTVQFRRLRPCLHGVGDPGLVGSVSFVFTLWGTQNKSLPH